MLYTAQLVVPSNTPPGSPRRVTLSATGSILHRAQIEFRSGTALLVGARILNNGVPIAPAYDWMVGDGETVEVDWSQGYALQGPATGVTLEAYNLDKAYAHTVIIKIFCETQ